MTNSYETSRCVLIVSHPGHELRILGWVARMQPLVLALTDGSGHTGQCRLAASKEFLQRAGCIQSKFYGRYSDREFYNKILEQDFDFFLGLSETIAQLLIEHNAETVVGDAIEGYNPSHDLCRLIIDRAVCRAETELKRTINNFTFPLEGHPSPEPSDENSMMITLSSAELSAKLTESQVYAKLADGMLVSEIAASLSKYGDKAFEKEVFSSSNSGLALANFEQVPPFYDKYGEQQVRAGIYRTAINFREHILPISRMLLP
jgi:hypothetical protein